MKVVIGDDASWVVPVLSLIITLISVVVGPLVAVWVARKQIHATVVTSTRQQWISSLRDAMAEFLTLAHHISALNGVGQTDSTHIEKIQKLVLLQHKIRLLLDPAIKPNQDLMKKAEEIRSAAFNTKPATSLEDAKRLGTLISEFMALAQVILKHEKVVIEEEIGFQ